MKLKLNSPTFLYVIAISIVINAGSWLHQMATELIAAITLFIIFLGWLSCRRPITSDIALKLLLFSLLFFSPLLIVEEITLTLVLRTILGAFLFMLLLTYQRIYLQQIVYLYSRLIYALGLISLFFWVADNVFHVMELFPIFLWKETIPFPYFNAFIYIRSLIFSESYGIGLFRNSSVFWEPGVLAVNSVLACFYLVFVQRRIKMLPFFIIILLTTLSTTAYLAIVLLIVAALIVFKYERLFKAVLVVMAVMGIAVVINPKALTFINQTLFDKLSTTSDVSGSLSLRSTNINIALNATLDSPWTFLIGHGRTNEVNVESGIVHVLHQNGFIFASIYMSVLALLFHKYMGWIGVLLIGIIINTQPLSYLPHVIVFLALGFSLIRLQKKSLQPAPVSYAKLDSSPNTSA